MNNKGSTLVLLIIIISLVVVLGTAVLNVVIKQYEIKRFHTDAKQSFYMSETGLNEAYIRTCTLIDESIIKAVQMAEDYLIVYPLNIVEAENIFDTNYRLNVKSNIKSRIETSQNPSVEIRNSSTLLFIDNVITVLIRSSYMHENNVEKLTWVELIVRVPVFDDVIDGMYNADDYIEFKNWNS